MYSMLYAFKVQEHNRFQLLYPIRALVTAGAGTIPCKGGDKTYPLNSRGLIRASGYKDSGTPSHSPQALRFSFSHSLSTPIARSIASFLPPTTPLYIALYFLHYQRGSGSNGSMSPGRRLFISHFLLLWVSFLVSTRLGSDPQSRRLGPPNC